MPRRTLVTGGAGFIGVNAVDRLLRRGDDVTVLDDLSRPGAAANLDRLRERHPGLEFVRADVRDAGAVAREVGRADLVLHLAGQTAVTRSVADPRADFEANALGTLNVLEGARLAGHRPIVLYASTNKVYGRLDDVPLVERERRYDFDRLRDGVDETRPLAFDSPYACSKGIGDQYTLAYARLYGIPAVVFRQSCVYGPWQLGVEEQGWVAWLVLAAVLGRPVTIFGDGRQVRDVLYVEDLLDAYDAAVEQVERAAGQAYNVGGGPANTLAVWAEFEPLLRELLGRPVADVRFADWRPGDQRVFYCDTRKAKRDLEWRPTVPAREGIEALFAWIDDQRDALAKLVAA